MAGKAEKKGSSRQVLRIRAKNRHAAGLVRCGVRHPRHAVEHPADRFTEEEMARLMADPHLDVQLVDLPPESAG